MRLVRWPVIASWQQTHVVGDCGPQCLCAGTDKFDRKAALPHDEKGSEPSSVEMVWPLGQHQCVSFPSPAGS